MGWRKRAPFFIAVALLFGIAGAIYLAVRSVSPPETASRAPLESAPPSRSVEATMPPQVVAPARADLPPKPSADSPCIEGRVSASDTREPIPGAAVTFAFGDIELTAKADGQGAFHARL